MDWKEVPLIPTYIVFGAGETTWKQGSNRNLCDKRAGSSSFGASG